MYRDINTIYMQIKKEKSKETDFHFQKPITTSDYTVPPFRIPLTRKKKTDREKLSKVYAIVDSLKHNRSSTECTILPLPTTKKVFISICGYQQGVSRILDYMKEIGLIETESDQYEYRNKKEENYSKTYRYYIENERLFITYCKENGIDRKKIVNRYISTQIQDIELFDKNGVRISSALHLKKPENWNKSQFTDYLKQVLHNNYKDLDYYEMLADHINDTYYDDYPDLQIRYEPRFTWDNKGNGSSYVHKIGIRATNALVNATKEKKENKMERQEVLDKYKLNLDYDVSSSVPRLTLSLNTGRWIREEEIPDIYYLIYREYEKLRQDNERIQKYPHIECEYNRLAVKKIFMFVYFDNTTDNNIGNHIRRQMNDKADKDGVYEQVALFKQATQNVIGDFDNSEIFYHESNIYMEVLNDLLEMGFFVWQVYDSWYARKDGVSQAEYQKLVSDLVEFEANKYINQI